MIFPLTCSRWSLPPRLPGSRRFFGSGSSAGGSVVRVIDGGIDANGFPKLLVDGDDVVLESAVRAVFENDDSVFAESLIDEEEEREGDDVEVVEVITVEGADVSGDDDATVVRTTDDDRCCC